MEDSIFTKIIKGDIPCHKVYEDEKTFAFVDINPIQPGHTLVVSKNQQDKFYDLPEEDYTALMSTVKKVALRLEKVIGKRVIIQILGYDVPHAHVHVIPADTPEEFRHIPSPNHIPDHDALAEMAKKLAF